MLTETSSDQRVASTSDDDSELPPNDFTVSPPAMSPSTSLMSSDSVDVSHKKGTSLLALSSARSLRYRRLTRFGLVPYKITLSEQVFTGPIPFLSPKVCTVLYHERLVSEALRCGTC